jgi:CheY-like chemotaxis protein
MDRRAGRKVVLVVEDNHDELLIYSTLLNYHGYAVLSATDYDSAMQVAAAGAPDLAIIDVNLGEHSRNGCELVAALREEPGTRDMPVIAHTAFGDVYQQHLERAGCSTVVHKPANPAALLDSVAELIGRPASAT